VHRLTSTRVKHFPRVCRLRGQGHPVCLPAGGITVPAGILVVDKGPKPLKTVFHIPSGSKLMKIKYISNLTL
jgi:hypothetical protein